MKTEIDSFLPQEIPATWALTERQQEGHHSYPLSPRRQNGMAQWQGYLRALTESSKAHGSAGQPSSKGSWNRRHLYYAIGDGQVTHCWDLSYFIWTTLRRNLGQLRGSARGKLLTNNEDSDTSHHPVVLEFSLSLSLSLSLSVSFQAKNSRLVSNLTFLLLPPKLLGSQLHTTEPHSSLSFYKANY